MAGRIEIATVETVRIPPSAWWLRRSSAEQVAAEAEWWRTFGREWARQRPLKTQLKIGVTLAVPELRSPMVVDLDDRVPGWIIDGLIEAGVIRSRAQVVGGGAIVASPSVHGRSVLAVTWER